MNRGLVLLGLALIVLGAAGLGLAAMEVILAWQHQPPTGIAAAPFPRQRAAPRVLPGQAPSASDGIGFTLIDEELLPPAESAIPTVDSGLLSFSFGSVAATQTERSGAETVGPDDALHYEDPWAEEYPAAVEEIGGAPVLAWDPPATDIVPAMIDVPTPMAVVGPLQEANLRTAAVVDVDDTHTDEPSSRDRRSRELDVPRGRLVFTDVLEPRR